MIEVRKEVVGATKGSQVPWDHSALQGRFYFTGVSQAIAPTAMPPPVPTRQSDAAEAWGVADRVNTVPAFEAFIRRFGDTYYGDLAKVRVAELKDIEAAKQAADAARKKAENDARAKADAEAERQRLALLEDKKRADVDATRKGADDAVPPSVFSSDAEFWIRIKDTNDPKNFEDYLQQIPNGRFAILAKRKLEVLKASAIKSNPERRVALVIGNSNYRIGGTLKNPVEDAAAMQVALHRLNFDLIVGQDLTLDAFQEKVREFTRTMKYADVALFFYAGLRRAVQGAELPAAHRRGAEERDGGLSARRCGSTKSWRTWDTPRSALLSWMHAATVPVVAKHTARRRPRLSVDLGRRARPNGHYRGSGHRFVGLACAPGTVAEDGRGRNGSFTEALLRHIATPDLELGSMFTAVRRDARGQRSSASSPSCSMRSHGRCI